MTPIAGTSMSSDGTGLGNQPPRGQPAPDPSIGRGAEHARPDRDELPACQDALQSLRLLALYRTVTPLFQAGTIYIAADQFRVSASPHPVVFMLALECLIAIATWAWLRFNHRVSALGLQLQATLDIALFTVMLYLTGGLANPFASLYLLPVMIVAMALPPVRLWATAGLTMLCYLVLREFHVPLSHPQGHAEFFKLHGDGEIVNYVLTSAMMVFFSTRLFASLRRHSRLASDAQEAQMRSESVAAIGALAAGSAHELGSPLSTLAVVAAELRHRHPLYQHLQHDVQVIEQQVAVCNRILARMASAGGERRAESATGARLDEFIQATVLRVQAMNPEATIQSQLQGPRPAPMILAEESLRQTISNVVHNAVRASPQQVHVAATWTVDHLDIVVTDCGPGFTAEALRTLGKGIAPGRGMGGGMGVGLLLGAETLQRMGGALQLMNNVTGGACVQVHLPVASLLINNAR